MTVTMASTPVRLDVGCDTSGGCVDMASGLYRQLRHGYDMCSVLAVPETLEEWRQEHRTARKRANRASRLGYRFHRVQRHLCADDIFKINTSKPERQGRRMSDGYWQRPSETPLPDYPCDRHRVTTYGVTLDGTLVAYLWLYRSGDLALVSSILGHADHLDNDVMYLLFQGVVSEEAGRGGVFVYNRHDSGTSGLRYYKERVGFRPVEVCWLP